MTFLNERNIIVKNFSRLVIGYTEDRKLRFTCWIFHRLSYATALHKLGIYCFPNFYSEQE